MQAVSRTVASAPVCAAFSASALERKPLNSSISLRPVGVSKSFAGRQLRCSQWAGQRRGGALAVEAKAVPVLSPVASNNLNEDSVAMAGQVEKIVPAWCWLNGRPRTKLLPVLILGFRTTCFERDSKAQGGLLIRDCRLESLDAFNSAFHGGDGETKHLDEPTDMPGEIRIDSDFVVGRTDDRADYVLPIATVSGAHARIEKKGDAVYVTDLESTNGTYIDQKRIGPNNPVELKLGSTVVFGDEHLAAFKLGSVEEEEGADN